MSVEPHQADDLQRLVERIEAASGPDRELDCRIWCAISGPTFDVAVAVVPDFSQWQAPFYTASIDAAMTLVPEGRSWELTKLESAGTAQAFIWNMKELGEGDGAEAKTPALALASAALRARITQEKSNG